MKLKFFTRKQVADPIERMGVSKPKQRLSDEDKEFMNNLLDTKQMFVMTDPHKKDHPIVYASEPFCEFTGYTNAEIVGKNCRFLQGTYREEQAANLDRVRAALVVTSKDEAKPVSVCLYNFKKDGTPFINQFFMTPLVDYKGDVVFFVGIQQQVFVSKLEESKDELNPAFVYRKSQQEKHQKKIKK